MMISCSKDSDSNITPATNTNLAELTFNGNNYSITNAKMIDTYHSIDEKHQYMLLFSDKDIVVDVGGFGSSFYYALPLASRFSMKLKMYSYGENIVNGTYIFDDNEPQNYQFFNQFSMSIDSNNDGYSDSHMQAVSGTITSSGVEPNNTLHFNIQLSNGQIFDFVYSGGFEYFINNY